MILDTLRAHHAEVFGTWPVKHEDEIDVFYLPIFSLELNADEYLNCDLKAGVHSGKPARDEAQLTIKGYQTHVAKIFVRPMGGLPEYMVSLA